MQRVSVIGSSGAGKTTLARELARRLGVPHVELDSIFHQSGWRPLDRETFQRRVRERVAAERWVADGNYNSQGVAQLVWQRADTIVWLDPSRVVVMAQIIPRSLRRVLSGEELWNGNRERLRNLFDRRPEENVVLWAWKHHAKVRARYAQMMQDATWSGREVFRLRSRREVEAFFAAHAPASAQPRSATGT